MILQECVDSLARCLNVHPDIITVVQDGDTATMEAEGYIIGACIRENGWNLSEIIRDPVQSLIDSHQERYQRWLSR